MKKNTTIVFKRGAILLYFLLVGFNYLFATTYTFQEYVDEDWTNSLNWVPNYPGLTIAVGDIVIIPSGKTVVIPNSSAVQIDGTLTNNGRLELYFGTLTINGTLTNNGDLPSMNIVTNSNSGIITNTSNGSFNARTMTNNGLLTNDNGGSLSFNLHIINNNTITNNGLLTNFQDMTNNGLISNNGTMTNKLTMINNGTIVNEGTLNNDFATLTNEGTLNNNDMMTNTYNVTNNGTLTNSDTIINDGFLINNSLLTNGGFIETQYQLTNEAAGNLTNTGRLEIYGAIENDGMLTNTGTILIYAVLDGGGVPINASMANDGTLSSPGIVSIDLNSTLTNNGTMTFSGNWTSQGTFTNNSKLEILTGGYLTTTGTMLNTDSLTIDGQLWNNSNLTNNGVITSNGYFQNNVNLFNNGTLVSNGGFWSNTLVNNTGMFIINGTMTSQGTIMNSGTMPNNGTLTSNGSLYNSSSLKGSGTINVSSGLTHSASSFIEPGNSIGTLTFNGDMNLTPTTYNAEIDGTAETTDLLVTNSTATLTDSHLSVIWMNPPTAPATYTIMTYANRIGDFATVTIPSVAGFTTTLEYTVTQINVIVTVELPVSLSLFKATKRDQQVVLDWRTESENNNKGFFIERSTGQKEDWTRLGFVAGDGNAVIQHVYSFLDVDPKSGVNYYRLKQTDFDGAYEYSEVVSVEINDLLKFSISPNPSQGVNCRIVLHNTVQGVAKISLLNSNGKLVSRQESNLKNTKEQEINLNVAGLSPGVYHVITEIEGKRVVQELVIAY